MAVIMEAFSIREYASRMRNIDVVKCWPFGEASEENMKAILPPISVKKFRWWLDEVDKISIIKRNNTINPEESECDSDSLASIRRKRLQKLKGKTPKKRSIVELFAVAPEVERPVSSDEDSIADSGFGKLKSLGTKQSYISCKLKQKEIIRTMLKHCNQKVFKKKRKITMKEKIHKYKSVPSVNPDCFDGISIHSKKTKVKSSACSDAKSKARRASKLISKNRKQDLLGHGILKRLSKTHTSENKVCLHKIQNLNKNYALSLKDDSDLSVADLLDKHSAIDKSVSFQETEETEEQTFKWGNHIDFQPPFENHLCSSNNLFNRSVPSDQCSQYPCCNGTSVLHLSEDLDSRVASVGSIDHFKAAHPQSFLLCSSTLNGSSVDNKELSLQNPWLPPMSLKEPLGNICCNQRSIMQIYGERTLTDDLYGLPLNSQEELIRLSSIENGGLYQLEGGSSVVTGTNICSNICSESLLDKPYCVNSNRVASFPNQLEQFAIKGSRNEFEQFQYRRINALTKEMVPSFPFESKLGQLKKPCFGARHNDQYTNYRTSEIIKHSMQLTPSTMRLMGQEFRIDGRGFQRPDNREFFKDKEIMMEQHVDTVAYASSFKSPFLQKSVRGVPKCIRMHSSDYNICRASGNLSHVMAQESVTFPHFDDRMGYRFSKGNSTHDTTYPHVSVSTDFVTHGSQSLMFHDMCKNTSRSWIQPENREMPVRAGKLPFEFPFPYSENYMQPLTHERSFEINPTRCFEPREKGLVVDYNQTLGGSDSVHHPWTAPPMAYQTSERSKLFPHYGSQNTIASAPLIHQDPAPHKPYGSKTKYQMQYNSRIGSHMLNDGNMTKKRMASASNQYHNKPIKMPRSGSLEDSGSATPVENARSNFKYNMGYHGPGSDSGSDKYKPCRIGYGENMINKNERQGFLI